jgi:glycosyltransferase involved in cell wall biosynthesis
VLFCAAAGDLPALDISQGVTIVRRGTRYTVYREARKFYETEGKGNFDLVIDEINTRPFLTPSFVKDVPVVALIHQVAREIWHHQFPFPANLAGRFYFEHRWLKQYKDVPVVTVSESSRASLEQYGLHHAITVPEGIKLDHEPIETKKEVAPTIVFCGRLTRNKRPHHAVAAFNHLVQRIPEAVMWVVGDGDMMTALRRKAHKNISFLGRVSHEEKFELMAKAHVLVATSVREGWGLVVTEAASVGTPAVAYDVAGLRDSVKASNGTLVTPDPRSLAVELESALPKLVEGTGPVPVVGGVAPWSEVAAGILAAAPIPQPIPAIPG